MYWQKYVNLTLAREEKNLWKKKKEKGKEKKTRTGVWSYNRFFFRSSFFLTVVTPASALALNLFRRLRRWFSPPEAIVGEKRGWISVLFSKMGMKAAKKKAVMKKLKKGAAELSAASAAADEAPDFLVR